MTARQEAAFEEYKNQPELSKSEIMAGYELTEVEAQDVIDFIKAWRES